MGAVVGGELEAKLEAHHEIDVGFGVLLQGMEDGGGGLAGDAVLLEDFVDFLGFVVGAVDDFVGFACELGVVMLYVAAGCEVATEAHGDGAGGDFCQAGDDDDVGGDGSGEAGGEGEGNGEAVGEADDDVAHSFCRFKVFFVVGVGYVVHGQSLSHSMADS